MRNVFLFKGRGNTSLVTEVDVHVYLRFMCISPLYVYISKAAVPNGSPVHSHIVY